MAEQKTGFNLPQILQRAQDAGRQRYMAWRGGTDGGTLTEAAKAGQQPSDAASHIPQAGQGAAAQAVSAGDAAKTQAEGIKGALGNILSALSGMSGTNKAALGVSAAAAIHGASGIIQRDDQGKRRIRFGKVLQVGVALAAGAATVYGHKQGGNTIDGTLSASKQVVGKFTEMLANRGAAGMSQTRG